jgi:hypothetical protein
MKIRLGLPGFLVAAAAVALASGALASGCDGGATSPAVDFCGRYATAFCQKVFACPDPNLQLPAGATQSQCVAEIGQSCTERPSGIPPAVNCYGSISVDGTAENLCLNRLMTTSCGAFIGGTVDYDATCSTVCTNAAPGGAGAPGSGFAGSPGSGAGGFTGSGTAGSSGGAGSIGTPPPNADAYCRQLLLIDCDQAFLCVPSSSRDDSFTMTFGATVQECKTSKLPQQCATAATDCAGYNPSFAQTCLTDFAAQTCADLEIDGPPSACSLACQP